MTLHEMQRRLKGFALQAVVAECIEETKGEIVLLNKDQLLHGLDKEGNYLSPKYSEDSYFKSTESARRYAEWKQKIDQVKDKPFDVPNLFITGKYHRGIGIDVSATTYTLFSRDSNASKIENKFSQKIYGLNPASKALYLPNYVMPLLKEKIQKRLGFKFN